MRRYSRGMAERRRLRGEGSIYQRASDGKWIGVIDLGWVGGRRIRRTVSADTKRELTPKFKRLKAKVEGGVLGDDVTVAEWLDHWLTEIAPARTRERTLQGYRGYVEQWLKPQLGRRRLSALKPDHVRALHRAMKDAGRSDATRRQAHMILRRALVVAVQERRLEWNPAALVDPPPVGKVHHDYHTAAEAKAVLRYAAGTQDAALLSRLMLAYLAGLRQGEALGLCWEDVDLEVGVAHVHQAVARIKGEGLVVGPVKSDASIRYVPLVAPVVEALADLRRQTGGRGFLFGGEHPVNPRYDWQVWKDALAAAGVKDVPLHGARASCASLLRELGESERVIADVLGHAQVATTQRAYIRSDDRQRREALEGAARAMLGE